MALLSLLLLTLSPLQNPTQTGIPSRLRFQAAPSVHGIPGTERGHERWLVVFKQRSFDLRAFRLAVQKKDSEEVEKEVQSLRKKALRDQSAFARFLEEKLEGKVLAHFWLVNACSVEIPGSMLGRLRSHPRVAYIHPDQIVTPVFIKNSTNARNHAVDALHLKGIKGAGATIAIMDTGLDLDMNGSGRPHATFYIQGNPKNRMGGGIKGSRLLAAKAIGKMIADDVNNHGTAVAGIAAGEKWNSNNNSDRGHAPLAGIVSYSIANDRSGSTDLTTITKAWQAIAADAVKYKIAVVNNSYSGSPDPTNVSQMALDAAAWNAGVLPVCAAGNGGASTGGSQSVANGLAVGATSADSKQVAAFSSRGPLFGDTKRFYPDICAIGVSLVQPLRDNEASQWIASGTSMAAPQVSGAATLFRSIQPRASFLLTKAALLASTEDISQRNVVPPFHDRNAFGLGFLRDDHLLRLAKGGGLLKDSALTRAATSARFNFMVTKGRYYAACVAWPRTNLRSKAWSDLSLEVKMGTKVLGSGDSPRNLYEKVSFRAPSTGTVQIFVRGKSLDSSPVPFGLALLEMPPPFVAGGATPFGAGCKGSGILPNLGNILPRGYGNRFGGTADTIPIGFKTLRYQQVFALSQTPKDFTTSGLAFRHDDKIFAPLSKEWIEITIKLGYAATSPKTISRSFAVNQFGPQSTLVARRRVNLPSIKGRNPSPSNFLLQIPFDRSFLYQSSRKKGLLLDLTKHTQSKSLLSFYTDSIFDRKTFPTSRVFSIRPQDRMGFTTLGYGSVVAFMKQGTSGAVPILENEGAPEIGRSYDLSLSRANSNSPAVFFLGNSKTKFQTITLPLDLSPLGMTGCKLHTNILWVQGIRTDFKGNGILRTTLPNLRSLIGVRLYHQAAIYDPPGNPFGLVLSNALQVLVGGQP